MNSGKVIRLIIQNLETIKYDRLVIEKKGSYTGTRYVMNFPDDEFAQKTTVYIGNMNGDIKNCKRVSLIFSDDLLSHVILAEGPQDPSQKSVEKINLLETHLSEQELINKITEHLNG